MRAAMEYEMKRHPLCRRQFLMLSVILTWCIIALWLFFRNSSHKSDGESTLIDSSQEFSRWPPLENQNLNVDCMQGSLSKSLSALESNLRVWGDSEDALCKDVYNRFFHVYNVFFRAGAIKIPPQFVPKVSKWLNNDENLLKELKNQHVIHILNKQTKEYSAFSPLRSKRPQSTSNNSLQYAETIIQETSVNCDFCNYETQTSEDIFGRIKTNFCVSAANTFKVDRWHSLIIPFKHNPLELSEEETMDIFNAALLWFNKVNSLEAEFKYPWILWDSMPHAGASQVHPHVHVGLSVDSYVMYENTRSAAQKHFQLFGTNYFTDLIRIHHALGLAVDLGKATAIAQLTSKKDTEITIISSEVGVDFTRMIYYVIRTYYDMGLYGFSSMTVFPIMGMNEKGSLPAIIRIATRGDVSSIRSEISSFELFQFSNINVDPYTVIEKLRTEISLKPPMYLNIAYLEATEYNTTSYAHLLLPYKSGPIEQKH
uniref:HIT domain-containing protein n=1 Tax=Strigamia maritima TaxID=126957 RepID=T1J0G1_STRMM